MGKSDKPSIKVKKDGPLLVKGFEKFERSDGKVIETKPATTLCRCGASKRKPFCDGVHKEIGFSDKKADVLLTGFCGPNAFKALDAAQVKVAGDVSGTVREALAAFVGGKVKITTEPNAQAHW